MLLLKPPDHDGTACAPHSVRHLVLKVCVWQALALHVQAAREDNAGLRRELAAVAEDLAALVRENQTVMGQLSQASAERDAAREEARAAADRAAGAESALGACQAGAAELRQAYEVRLQQPHACNLSAAKAAGKASCCNAAGH